MVGDQLSAQLQLSELATATSAALQAQMEPHFVFNALNTIASLVRTDPDRARGLVLAFADYVRSKLARPNEFVTLDEELRHVQSYLDLEQARFGSQLEVTLDVPPDARAVRLPPYLVQPLVENAVKHGKTDRPLHLIVRARVRRGTLRADGARRRPRHRARRDRARARAGRVGEREHGPRARERPPPADRVLRRGREAALVPVRHRRAARGSGRMTAASSRSVARARRGGRDAAERATARPEGTCPRAMSRPCSGYPPPAPMRSSLLAKSCTCL